MAVFQNSIVPAAAASDEEVVTRSLRFDGDASLQRTPTSAGDSQTWTMAFWVKRSGLGSLQNMFHAYDGSSSNRMNFRITANDVLDFYSGGAVGQFAGWDGNSKLRDTGAWYHICLVVDVTQSTASDRIKVWINGSPETLNAKSGYNAYPAQNATTLNWNNGAYEHEIGDQGGNYFIKQYMADLYFVDGTAVSTPVGNFIEANDYGGYKPKAYDMSSHVGNSFHLEFEDSDTAFIGFDSSLNGAVSWNTNKYRTGSYGTPTWSASNTQFDGVSGNVQHTMSNYEGSGKYYAEFEFTGGTYSSDTVSGVGAVPAAWWTGSTLNSYMYSNNDAARKGCAMVADEVIHVPLNTNNVDCSGTGSEPHFTVGTDRIGIEVDGTANTAIFYRVNSSEKVQIASLNNSTHGIDFGGKVAWGCTIHDGNHSIKGYFAQSDWLQSPSTGYVEMPAGNHFTATNLASSDVVLDRPSNNYATLNPLIPYGSGTSSHTVTLSEGNLRADYGSGSGRGSQDATIATTSGKFYFEAYVQGSSQSTGCQVGVHPVDGWVYAADSTKYLGFTDTSAAYESEGELYTNATNTSTGYDTYTTGDVIGCAFDVDSRKVWFSKNGTWQNSGNPSSNSNPAVTLSGSGSLIAAVRAYHHNLVLNFGQDPTFANQKPSGQDTSQSEFYYAPPSGFKSLCTANLDDPTVTPHENFEIAQWVGNETAGKVISTDIRPDLVWIKNRDVAKNHTVGDSVRGANKALITNNTNSESTATTNITAFDTDASGGYSFTLGTSEKVNDSGKNHVGWVWKESATAGFDIVTYDGDGVSSGDSQSVSHSLGVAPDMIIVKARDGDAASDYYARDNWYVWHKDLATNELLFLNTTASAEDYSSTSYYSPISSVGSSSFTVKNAESYNYDYDFLNWGDPNGYYSGNIERYVAYLFSGVEGFSKFGKYTGNGSSSGDGTFVYCGFRPAFIMVKSVDSSYSWYMHDAARSPSNYSDLELTANSSGAEYSVSGASAGERVDFLSNGFKNRTSNVAMNGSNMDYIFMAFAEQPFSAPSNAR